MNEQTLSGGYFGESMDPRKVPTIAQEFTVHGGYFGGVKAADAPPFPDGWLGDAHSVFLDALDEFGEDVEYQPAGGDPFRVAHGAIYRDSHVEIDPQSLARITSDQITADMLRAAVPSDWSSDDLLIVRGRLHRIYDLQEDGEVGSRAVLHEVLS